MVTKLQNHLSTTDLLPPQSKLIVAVSGGVDSVTLLDTLTYLQRFYRWKMVVAHYDHQVRPDSFKDAELVAQLSEDRDLKYYLQKHNSYEKTEAALRKARYEFLEELRDAINYDLIVTAHHNNDRIETAIFNTIRGADRRGITSLHARRDTIVRPLLPFTKAEIITHANLQNLPYREDSTNQDIGFSRNFVRHVLVPQGSLVYKNFHHTFTKRLNDLTGLNTSIDNQLDLLLEDLACSKSDEEIALDKEGFRRLPVEIAKNLFIHIAHYIQPGISLSKQNIAQAENFLLSAGTGSSMHVKNGLHIRLGYDTVKVTRQAERVNNTSRSSVHILTAKRPYSDDVFTLSISTQKQQDVHNLLVPKQKLIVRHRQGGDRVYPVGMTGSKKLQDIFVDKKVPRSKRDSWPVLVNNQNEIIWLPNLVVDRRALSDTTARDVMCITCEIK